MKKSIKKIFAAVTAAFCVAAAITFGGCMQSVPRDPINGKDLNIYDIYEAAKEASGNPDMTMQEFLKEYFSYTSSELEAATSVKAAVNRALMSSVTVKADWDTPLSAGSVTGSGVIIDIDCEKGDMTVVTNCHVLYSARMAGDGFADSVSLWLYGSESSYPETNENNAIAAKIVATSKSHDIAVLKVENSARVKQSKAVKAEWATGEENYLGETVFAIGNANADKISSSVGFISKDIEDISVNLGTSSNPEIYSYGVLRTSATINSGNSGGGLYNLNCQLVGIVNAKHKEHDTVGYALPAAASKRVVARMLADYNGTETHGVKVVRHGVFVTVSDSYSTGLNDDGYVEIREIVRVNGVAFGKTLGTLTTGDVLKRVRILRPSENDRVIEDMDILREHNFYDVMLSAVLGDTVEYTIERDGTTMTLPVTYDEESDFVIEE